MGDSSDSASLTSSEFSLSSEPDSATSESSSASDGVPQVPLATRHLIAPGVSKPIFEALRRKALQLPPQHRLCALLLHEVELQPHINYLHRDDFIMGFEDFGWGDANKRVADTAGVFMLRSIYGAWKQPVAFVFFDWPLRRHVLVRLLKEIARESRAAGLNLVSFVCTPAEYNVSAVEVLRKETLAQVEKGAEVEEGALLVGGHEIAPIFDPCTLLLDVRNNLVDGDVAFAKSGVEKVAKWKHIQEAYELDRHLTQHLRKLTEHHVDPDKINRGSVTTSVQVFSSTVGDFLKTVAGKTGDGTRSLPLEAVETAELVSFFDRVFDSVNGRAKEAKSDKPLRGLVTEDSQHAKVWLEGKQMFATMKMCNEDPEFQVRSFEMWTRTLDGFELVRKKLRKLGYDSFPARSFNLDPLENCFDVMKEWANKKKKNPGLTCTRFSSYYNKALASRDVAGCHASEPNCEFDGLAFLVTIHDFKSKRRY